MQNSLPEGISLGEFDSNSGCLIPKKHGHPSVTDVQYLALEAGVSRGKRLLVRSPSGTGKSLIAWWAACQSFNREMAVLYVTSSDEAARQIYESAQRLFLDRPQPILDPMSAKKRLVVMTYEVFDGMLDAVGNCNEIGLIVCDDLEFPTSTHVPLSMDHYPRVARATARNGAQFLALTNSEKPEALFKLYADCLAMDLVYSDRQERCSDKLAA